MIFVIIMYLFRLLDLKDLDNQLDLVIPCRLFLLQFQVVHQVLNSKIIYIIYVKVKENCKHVI